MKIYKTEQKINKCSECPFIEIDSDTLGPEAYTVNCKTNNLKYYCNYKDVYKFIGEMDWKDGKWIGSFTDNIPTWCPLPKYNNKMFCPECGCNKTTIVDDETWCLNKLCGAEWLTNK